MPHGESILKEPLRCGLRPLFWVQEGDENAWRAVQHLTIPLKNDPAWMKLAGNLLH